MKHIRIAILDMYDGHANEGMRCIREIIQEWGYENQLYIKTTEFDVRLKQQLPDLSFDVYISTGGPGSPIESEGTDWENKYFAWLKHLIDYNSNDKNAFKKHVFFICHSFQLACRYFNVGNVCKRKSTSFGVFPVHMVDGGYGELAFHGLKNPFYAVDSRDYQVIEPDISKIKSMGGEVLCIEKERPHVPLERAVMGIRFNQWLVGTQFHPEADAIGMSMYLLRDDKKKAVIEEHGESKWRSMVEHLQDPDKILSTYHCILPNFLNEVYSRKFHRNAISEVY